MIAVFNSIMYKRSELFFSLILVPIDFLAFLSAFVLAYIIRVKLTAKPIIYPIESILFLKIFLLILPIWILIFALCGLYDLARFKNKFSEEMARIFIAVSAGTMFVILVDFASKQPIFPAKAIPVYGYLLSFVLVTIVRFKVRLFRHYLYKFNIGVRRTLIVGGGDLVKRIIESLENTRKSGYQILGIINDGKSIIASPRSLKIYSSLENAVAKLGKSNVDEIIQANPQLSTEQVLATIEFANDHHINYRFIPNQFNLYTANSSVTTLGNIPIVSLRRTPLEGWGRVLKRLFDLMGSALGLVILAPIFLVIALAIKITDPGPVIYKHKRLSRFGKLINVYKFRTMHLKYCTGEAYSGRTDAEVLARELKSPNLAKQFQKNQKLKNDPRVSKIGRILRQTSLDELPQLFNVLKGDVSLVGPRPVVEAELEHYGNRTSIFLALRPGLTGLWQVSGRNDLSYEERVKMDIYYIENWNMWLDIKILFKTLPTLIKKQGAY